MEAQLSRWGNSLGVRIPKELASKLRLAEGMRVDIEAREGEIVIKAVRPRYCLEELLVGLTPEDIGGAFDWGPDLGRENPE